MIETNSKNIITDSEIGLIYLVVLNKNNTNKHKKELMLNINKLSFSSVLYYPNITTTSIIRL